MIAEKPDDPTRYSLEELEQKMMKKPEDRITIRFSNEELEYISRESERTGQTKSEVIRDLIAKGRAKVRDSDTFSEFLKVFQSIDRTLKMIETTIEKQKER